MDGMIFIMVWSTSWILLRKKLSDFEESLLTEFDCFTWGNKIWEPIQQENGVEVAQMDRENRRVRASCKLFAAAVVTSLHLQNTGKRSMSTRKWCSRKGTREHLVEDVWGAILSASQIYFWIKKRICLHRSGPKSCCGFHLMWISQDNFWLLWICLKSFLEVPGIAPYVLVEDFKCVHYLFSQGQGGRLFHVQLTDGCRDG